MHIELSLRGGMGKRKADESQARTCEPCGSPSNISLKYNPGGGNGHCVTHGVIIANHATQAIEKENV